ncbi:3-deoxy-D-manno-octulosonate 8-phosphate phosphatase KdsC [Candidatus Arsenophonus lipoptenae]|uniref:3-deoxy-D-manno-octulosonate 8-phosphate phosphatase KdsC n=1 Tax=Candidatus Arsenophonus lipoptenae TaxID=634113 RepID=A0A109QB84_9GAMM|nr:3-deoxy-manno-octulosonate-8-phosphatase KdsC [Candidatus Arsenophonus lipoptenae]AMA65006.1 3-deoxy-D-manno-octulosonate 8-phosphate phosphatase KdsC [Candidatus Arsenophonus lipoptenae]
MNENNKIKNFYIPVKSYIIEKAQLIKLLICDVDGVMTDGLVYMGNDGEEFKVFNAKDGYGIRSLLNNFIEVAIITGSKSKLLEIRAKTLDIHYIYQGYNKKILAYNDLKTKLKLESQQIAYIGDDLIDWPVMEKIGLSVAVADAHPFLLERANYITSQPGGKGAVREVCDLILFAHNKIKNK